MFKKEPNGKLSFILQFYNENIVPNTSGNDSNKEFVNYSVVILKILLINIILPYCLLTKPLQTEILTTSFFLSITNISAEGFNFTPTC